jgi:mannose-6-phosphate isomerase-like protein (cupin superfamily)
MPVSQSISIKNAPHFVWGKGCNGYWLKKDGLFTIISEIMPSGAAEKRHLHRSTEQFFYCLNGILSIELNGDEHTLYEGDGITIPPDAPHTVYNSSGKNVNFLVISCPNLLEDKVHTEDIEI